MAKVKQFLEELTERYQSLGGVQKLLVAALGGSLLLAGIFWGLIGSNGDYGVLFANLSVEDAGAITAKLKGKKVPYTLEAGGSTILAPRSQVYDLRLALAGEGIPRGGGVGFELFDRQTLGATDFVQRLNYQRALQGELSRTIGRIPEIAETRVHIVTPKESLFVEGQKEARAAVAVKLRPGRFLNQPQIDGVVHLVASAVEGLHPSQVTVVDLSGKILSKPQDLLSPGGLSSAQMTVQRQVEAGLERKLQTMYDQVLGPHKSIVRVAADLDFQKISATEEHFTPNRESGRIEPKNPGRKPRRVAPANHKSRLDLGRGAFTDSPEPAAPGSASERQSELRLYEVNRTVRQVVENPGKIKRLSVAVVLDGIYKEDNKGFTPRPPAEISQFANLGKKALGFDAARGDQFEISCAPLAPQAPEGVMAASPPEERGRDSLGTPLKMALVAIPVLALFWVLLRKRRASPWPRLEGPATTQFPSSQAGEEFLPAPASAAGKLLGAALTETADGKDRLSRLISAYPDRAVEILRLWLHNKNVE